jgi:hypothetical protein
MTMKVIWAVVALFLVLHILIAGQIGLTVDGAHYALYGKYLALNYYDHPPLVGWLQASLLAFGNNDFLMRVWPFIFSTATFLSLYYIAPRILPKTSSNMGGYCILMYFLAVIINVLGIDLIPQTLLLFFGLWTTYSLYQVTQNPSWLAWLRLGLYLGISGLSEYTALPFAAGICLYFLIFDRQAFKSIKFYMALLVALGCISPIIVWNAQNQWISILYQLHHGLPTNWNWGNFFSSLLIQLGAYGLAPVVFGTLGFIYVLRGQWRDTGSQILTCLGLPIIILFIYSGGHQQILPHWPALGWLLAIPLAVRYLIEHWQRLWVRLLLYFSASLVSVLYLLVYTQIFFGWIPFPLNQNPFNDLYGWQRAAIHSKMLLQTLNLPEGSPHLFVPNWTLASRISWYSHEPVVVASTDMSQFQLWYGSPTTTSNGIMIVPTNDTQPKSFNVASGQFQNCQYIDTITTSVHGKAINQFSFYHCRHFNT